MAVRKKVQPATSAKRERGRPPTSDIVRRTTVNLNASEVERIDRYREHLKKELPIALSEPAVLKLLAMKALEAYEREHQAHPELPLESTTTKSKK